jgi:tungstate transport system ATP-binding protein
MTVAGPLLLSLQGAGVRFGEVTALREVNLDLRRGERVALVGSNGGGKTTLLRLLQGQLGCSSGSRAAATVAGAAAPRIAMLHQRPFLLSLSAEANVALALWLAGQRGAARRERTRTALGRVGVAALARRAARSLSGGQQQRLALARAWAVAPDLLLLDEPTANLDPHAKREVEALMAGFADEGITLVWSTHNLGQVKRLATRALVLEGGQVIVDLPLPAFFEAELPAAAAMFLSGELPW